VLHGRCRPVLEVVNYIINTIELTFASAASVSTVTLGLAAQIDAAANPRLRKTALDPPDREAETPQVAVFLYNP
jgi:hypothetical protein